MTGYIIISFNILRLSQDGRQFSHDIFKYIFLNENVWISTAISPNYVPKGPINNEPAVIQNRQQNIIWTKDGIIYRRKYASLGLDELRNRILWNRIIVWLLWYQRRKQPWGTWIKLSDIQQQQYTTRRKPCV